MAKGGFDLAAALGAVPIPGTNAPTEGREQIEYIDIDLLDADANNFYQLSDLDELAANIEFVGLQQPLRVRPNPDKPGYYIVVSGHRRRAALQQLVAGGREDLRAVPCIREQAAGSAALQELRLIYANSDTRRMSSAEISQQAERVEMLLYQLKEEGVEFPGRMRDHVAAACKITKSRLSRLKVIREKLIPEFTKYYKAGDLKETPAYALAQQPAEIQKLVCKYTSAKDRKSLSEWKVNDTVGKITPVVGRKCKMQSGAACTHKTVVLDKLFDGIYGYKPCDRVCCDKCDNLASCKTACPLLSEKVKRLRADRRAQNAQEKAAKAAKDQPRIDEISEFWRREASARAASGKSVKELFAATESYYSQANEQSWVEKETLQKIRTDTILPFGTYGFYLGEAHRLIATAKCLGVTTDYLLGLSDEPYGAVAPETGADVQESGRMELIRWENRGKTPPIGALILTYDLTNTGPVLRPAVWDGSHFHAPGNPGKELTGLKYTQWLRIPMAHSGETYQMDNSPAYPEPCVACKSAHPGCDKC
ncbi:MAG: ParB N-terminal domain-containing protein, partial [Elusimicrobiales bacterium]|nr:ParB N-terminal domain-containing protein [Elusimicrobiales bacterium]